MTDEAAATPGAAPANFVVGWRQVAACFMLLAATGMVAATYSLVAVQLAKEFHPSRMVLMLAMTVLSGAAAVLAPLLGHLMDKVSVRKLMVAGALCLALGYTVISFATTFNQVLVIFALLMAPANVLIGPVGVTVLLSRWFAKRRGRALGIAIAGISAGGFLFPMIIQGLLDAYEWREALRWLGLILLVWTVPMALLVVDRPADRGLNPDGEADTPQLAREELSKAAMSVREILSDPAFWMIAVTVAIVTAGMKGTATNLAPLVTDAGVKASDAAKLISLYAGCSFVAKLSFAAFADRVGPRRAMFAALGGFALGMACLTQAAAGYSVIALGVAIVGLAGGLMVPIESYLAPRVFGARGVGRAMGLLSSAILIGLLMTPPLFGLIFDVTGSYSGIFWAFCALALVALLWTPLIRLHPRETRAPATLKQAEAIPAVKGL